MQSVAFNSLTQKPSSQGEGLAARKDGQTQVIGR
nr:MAG TPA: hypothetical protein [Caudoviricetes sp.]